MIAAMTQSEGSYRAPKRGPKFLLWSPEPDYFGAWSPEYLITVKPGAPNWNVMEPWSPAYFWPEPWSPKPLTLIIGDHVETGFYCFSQLCCDPAVLRY